MSCRGQSVRFGTAEENFSILGIVRSAKYVLLLEPLDESLAVGSSCKDNRMAGRTKGVRHTCPGPSKGRGKARYFAPKGTQGKGRVGRKSKAEG